MANTSGRARRGGGVDFSALRHRVTFQKPSGKVTNSMGEDIPLYLDFATVWAAVEPLTGREYSEAQKIRAETTYRVTVRLGARRS